MEHGDSSIAILGIGTAVPAYRLEQAETSARLMEALKDNADSARWARRIFKQCGVETRYTCEPNLLEPASSCRYFPSLSIESIPSTAERMQTYKRESVPLGLEAARKALADAEVNVSEITHLLTVSCTGQFLPGMDAALVKQLGLSDTVNRIPLQFLGCAAGLKAVCLSKQIAAGQPGAKVLVVCVELCTLHIQPSTEREALFAASFFGDGASSCVIGAADREHKGIFQLGKEHSALLPDSANEMVWELGDYGFDLFLSPSIPKQIAGLIPAEARRLLEGEPDPQLWAIHPGGRGIVDALQDVFGLTDEQTEPSYSVLRHYGNVSSATILFVLDEMRRGLETRGSGAADGIAMAFGPGLTVEMIRIVYVPAVNRQEELLAGKRSV
ncbi:type III polyketide synthase [Paenibacillus sp. H1-7]|uniref:type III polyketide synthase n=1 Tax=Paenibacillus sp. H1-7 TaxID=2282849 RepID=UPI001EF92DCA|nr:type III polyketide synthase [Paenibacillus sp. H1-7]ULL17012.1 type III polyketide synthase [Paenibacillus sp. H1-7]